MVGIGYDIMIAILSGSVAIPCSDTICPTNLLKGTKNNDLATLIEIPNIIHSNFEGNQLVLYQC